MKTIMLTILTAAALGTACPQTASRGVRLSELKAQQPPEEVIFDSALCQRAREAPNHTISRHPPIDPKTLMPDLNSLIAKSNDVVLATYRDHAELVSPSRENPVMYVEVRVIRSWKGSHRAGDILTFGWPGGRIRCDSEIQSAVWVMPGGDASGGNNGQLIDQAFVLFLRQSKDQEAQLVEGLRPAAGEGMQGFFPIHILDPTGMRETCPDSHDYKPWENKNVEPCASYLETNRSPIVVPYAHDPLHKKYNGVPASDFLREVQSVAAGQAGADKSSLR
jgi:hypothetical protein